ncbi:hypothetical protein FRC07_010328 [Ceratobasidium sp. 392]|nr:hypothetical protein FRC07_010328 [Ceratobasidium sp. 392]
MYLSHGTSVEDTPPDQGKGAGLDPLLGTLVVRVRWCFCDVIEDPEEVDECAVEELLYQMESEEVLGNPLNEKIHRAEFSAGVEECSPDKAQRLDEAKVVYNHRPANMKMFWFVFRYRHPDWLVAENIAPRDLIELASQEQPDSTPVVKSEDTKKEEIKSNGSIPPALPSRKRSPTKLRIKQESLSPSRGAVRSVSQRRTRSTQSPTVKREPSDTPVRHARYTRSATKRANFD